MKRTLITCSIILNQEIVFKAKISDGMQVCFYFIFLFTSVLCFDYQQPKNNPYVFQNYENNRFPGLCFYSSIVGFG